MCGKASQSHSVSIVVEMEVEFCPLLEKPQEAAWRVLVDLFLVLCSLPGNGSSLLLWVTITGRITRVGGNGQWSRGVNNLFAHPLAFLDICFTLRLVSKINVIKIRYFKKQVPVYGVLEYSLSPPPSLLPFLPPPHPHHLVSFYSNSVGIPESHFSRSWSPPL